MPIPIPEVFSRAVLSNSTPVSVILHPPCGKRTSWYAYTAGWISSRSTGQSELNEAVKVAENMLRNGGRKPELKLALLTDDELEEIQRMHFGRHQDERKKTRAAKSLAATLDAIAAFREITGVRPVTSATADDCTRWKRVCLTLPKLWRKAAKDQRLSVEQYSQAARDERQRAGRPPDALDGLACYSPNYVLKLSRTLQAAFERANYSGPRKLDRQLSYSGGPGKG